MKEDYLWDKTGEPDPEIQQLEEILGTLRYQPKPLELPQEVPAPRQRRNHFPLVAIAASVLLALVAAGVWLRVRTQGESQPNQAQVSAAPQPPEKTPGAIGPTTPDKPASEDIVAVKNEEQIRKNQEQVSKGLEQVSKDQEQVRKRGLPPLRRRYTNPEREEALAAKQQVMLALRLASEKLNLVHKKTQNTTPSNQIKNQHRVG